MANSISARQRWAESHFLRTSVISQVFDDLGMVTKEDVARDLKESHIKRMLNVENIGSELRDTFINECIFDSNRFEQRIKGQKTATFATEGQKYQMKFKENKLIEVRMERDLFGSILFLTLQRKIDMGEVFKYPLPSIPLSLCHVDGTLQKTQKSKILADLEGFIVHTEPITINVIIVDAMFFLHLINDPPTTFGDISKFILRRICMLECDQIHLVFDKVVKPSIKDCERDARAGASDRSETFEIYGPSQKRPQNFIAALRNDSFKESLIRFLVSSWEDPFTAEILKDKTIFVTCDNRCFCYNVEDGQLQRNDETHLYSNHEEADLAECI